MTMDQAPRFRCDVVSEGTVARVIPVGELDIATCSGVERALRELSERTFDELRLDLSRTTFVDSTAIHMILAWVRRASERGARFTLAGGGPEVRRALDVAGLLDRLPFVEA